MQRILVLGGGFAGLWSAVGAARRLDELAIGPDVVEILVVNRTPSHSIRVRNYEADLNATLVPLADVLDPIGVKHIVAEVTDIKVPEQRIACTIDGVSHVLAYDRLVLRWATASRSQPFPVLRRMRLTSTPMRPRYGSRIISIHCHSVLLP
jgi:NADH dehydrogenase